MGILDVLGLSEDDLNPYKQPASIKGEDIPLDEECEDFTGETEFLDSPDGIQDRGAEVLPEDEGEDFFQKLRNGDFDPPQAVTHPSEESSKPKFKSKKVVYSVKCTLSLSGSDYNVELLYPDSNFDKGYRLTKIGAKKTTTYDVLQADGQIVCGCADFMYRHEGADSEGCKHIRGLVDLGMFAAPPSGSSRVRSQVFDD